MIKSKSWFIPKTKTRPNRAWIHIQPYDYGVLVLWPVTGEQLKREYLHIARDDGSKWPDEAFESTKGKFISNGETDCIAFFDSRPSPGVIAHEAFHYTKNLSKQLDLKGEEAKAYLLMYVTDRIYELTRGKDCLI